MWCHYEIVQVIFFCRNSDDNRNFSNFDFSYMPKIVIISPSGVVMSSFREKELGLAKQKAAQFCPKKCEAIVYDNGVKVHRIKK